MGREHEQIRTALLRGTPSTEGDLGKIDRETLFFVESELVEDYLEGSLNEEESELFRTKYLVTDDRRDLLNEVRLLKRFSSGSIVFDAEAFEREVIEEETSGRTKVPLIVVGGFVVLFIVAFFIFYFVFR